ncbi:MAG TPA: universal stress protein [Euzebyales bacterium]|nr:universal stress protein [Euzebyales bacterium]
MTAVDPAGTLNVQRIVVGVDGSPQADRALAWAVREAELRVAAVDVVHCYVVHARGVVMYVPDQDAAEARLDEIIDRNQHVLGRVKWTAGAMGVFNASSAGLVDAGEDAALIVVGSRGAGGFDRLRLGSTGYRTAAHATTPVAVIPPTAEDDLQEAHGLIVGVDGSQAAQRALLWATEEAGHRNVRLAVVHAFQLAVDPMMVARASDERRAQLLIRGQEKAEQVVRDALAAADVSMADVTRVIERGAPADVLLSHTGPGRLLVLGTHGRGAIGRIVFGSVSHQCLHHAAGPVVVVP